MPMFWGVFLGFLLGFCAAASGQNLWPLPKSVSYGSQTLYLSKEFGLVTEGSNYPDGSGILNDAFARVLGVIKADHVVDGIVSGSNVLAALHVVVLSPNDTLNYGVDESYKLSVPAAGNPIYAHIEAQTVYGALHALQTFSQLCYINLVKRTIQLSMAPWSIIDQPRFPYRGLLIDTSRHYLPVPIIKSVIDSMTYSKLNVLHWHIVDTQSFPLQIPSYPKLWNGAYSSSERYTMADAIDIVQYAERRGINVLAEIDVPGHALSWGKGYPYLWPSTDCQQPLDVSNELTFKVIDGILSDFSKVFKFRFVHLGGDEVNTSCWTTTPHVHGWLKKHKMNESGAYEYFVLRAQKIAVSHGYDIINWEETFNNFGNKLDPRTIVHNWLGGGVAEKVVAAGLRCIVSNQDKWYLDHLDATWQGFYTNEPLVNISKPEQQKLVLGGEVCMWGEHIDASDIQQTIWPRAAAAAESMASEGSKFSCGCQSIHAIPSSSASKRCSYRQSCSNNSPTIQLHELVKSLPTCGCGFKSSVKYSTSQTNPGRAYFNCRDFPKGCRFFWWIERELLSGDSQRDVLVEELDELRRYLDVYKEELREIIRTVWVKNLVFFGYGFVCGILFVVIVMVLLKM